MKSSLLNGSTCLVAGLLFALPAQAQTQPESPNPDRLTTSPLETIIVVGTLRESDDLSLTIDPQIDSRLATLDDLFRGVPGVQLEPVFGGIDHPRFSIRGSGLQRGTQPAGRGIELRLDGLTITYADTSFDFVEWIDPLLFDSARTLRGGRGALQGATSLGGIVDFQTREGDGPLGGLVRLEAGSFDYERAQLALGGDNGTVEAYATATWFAQDGFREYGAQDATRIFSGIEVDLNDRIEAGVTLLYSDSELELPGPQTLAQIKAGSEAAQPNGINGDWRRFSERMRVAADLDIDFDTGELQIDAAYMDTDVEFRRRDVQVEDNQDIALAARFEPDPKVQGMTVGAGLVFQRNDRRQRQFFNGGGTPPSFTGARGDLWADNDLTAERLTAQITGATDVQDTVRLELAAGWDWHSRRITDDFATRAARPAAVLDRDYDSFNGLALLSWDVRPALSAFAGLSHVGEPPTYDVLLINRAGTPGPMKALLNGSDPRRPIIRDLDSQTATTLEGGLRGRLGDVGIDATLFHVWMDNEIVSTTNAVTQNVTSVGNADDTIRFGIEARIDTVFALNWLTPDDALDAELSWTWTEARFDDDLACGDNDLPIVVPHLLEGRLVYNVSDAALSLFVTHAPDGGFADYANTLRADGYTTVGARFSYNLGPVMAFIEGRNLTDERYVSSVIGARNNLAGQDNAIFAPGEPAAFTIGLQASF